MSNLGRLGAERALRKLRIDPAPIAKFYFDLPLSTRQTQAEDVWRGG